MNTMRLIFTTIASMELILTITLLISIPTKRESFEEPTITITNDSKTSSIGLSSSEGEQTLIPIKQLSHRFLAEKNLRAADKEKFHCNKDTAVCSLKAIPGSSCCNNKCVDLTTDKHNCGACKNTCKYPESCCGGKCVNLAFDKKGIVGNATTKCMSGGYCVYGMCNYA